MAKKKKRTTKKKKTTKSSKSTEMKPRTKAQLMRDIAEETELPKGDVEAVFESMQNMIKKDLGRRGPGQFTVPGLMKIQKIRKPRKPQRRGINPFTGEETTFKAKPAHNVVKVRPLKGLKEMV